MNDYNDYTIEELLSEIKNDSSWESDALKREALVNQLKDILERV